MLTGLLARDWSGLLFAAVLAAFGVWGVPALGAPSWLGALCAGLAAVLSAGALWHLWCVARALRAHPPPGLIVDAGGIRIHLLAEGTQHEGRPAVVWFCGAHGSGALMGHLHRRLSEHTRSILIDRGGTGWSDTGPFPRTTAREAEECLAALEAAGERGPFVFAGHSFGGLLAANMARRCPEQTAALVLLDATPPDTIIFGPRLGALREMRVGTWVGGVLRLFGIHESPLEKAQRRQAPHMFEEMGKHLGADVMRTERALGLRARGMLATASIFAELSPEGMARAAWDTAVYEGDLGDLPVLLVAPGDALEVNQLPEVAHAPHAREAERIQRVIARSRERYMTVSTRTKRVVTPAGTGHNFPYEAPAFVAEVVRGLVEQQARPGR